MASLPPLAIELHQSLRRNPSFKRLAKSPSIRRLCSDIALVQLGLRVACLVDAFDTSDEARILALLETIRAAATGGDAALVLLRHASTQALFVCHEESLRELVAQALESDVESRSAGASLLPLAYIDAATSTGAGQSVSRTPPPSLLALLKPLHLAQLELSQRRRSSPNLVELSGGHHLSGVALSGLLLGYSTVFTLEPGADQPSSWTTVPDEVSAVLIDVEALSGAAASRKGQLLIPSPAVEQGTTSNNLSDVPLRLIKAYLRPRASSAGQRAHEGRLEVCSFSLPVYALGQVASLGCDSGERPDHAVERHVEQRLNDRIARALVRLQGGEGSGSRHAKASTRQWLEGMEAVVEGSEVSLNLVGL